MAKTNHSPTSVSFYSLPFPSVTPPFSSCYLASLIPSSCKRYVASLLCPLHLRRVSWRKSPKELRGLHLFRARKGRWRVIAGQRRSMIRYRFREQMRGDDEWWRIDGFERRGELGIGRVVGWRSRLPWSRLIGSLTLLSLDLSKELLLKSKRRFDATQ